MLLAIDVGNSNSKFAVFDGDKIVAQFRLRTESKRTADEYAAWLTQLMDLQGFDPHSITGAILASVVPPVNPHIRRLCETYFKSKLLIVGEPERQRLCRLALLVGDVALLDHAIEHRVAAEGRFLRVEVGIGRKKPELIVWLAWLRATRSTAAP